MSSNGQIIDPTKPKFHQQWIPGPLAQSTSVTIQTPTGAQVVTFSGKSLLLDVATELACAAMQGGSVGDVDGALDMAERLINGSFERMQRGGKDDSVANEE